MGINLIRHCPRCNKELTYSCKESFNRGVKSNAWCHDCSMIKCHASLCDDLTGKRSGYLTVIRRSPENKRGRPQWICKCDCGNQVLVTSNHIRLEQTKSCGCRTREMIGNNGKKAPFLYLFNKLKYNAKRRNISITLSFEELKDLTRIDKCHYCGSPIIWKPHAHRGGYNIDRKDSSVGYTKENCVVCCKICNTAKNVNFSYDEMKQLGICIKNILSTRTSYIYTQCNKGS